jgi:hypothetical protein
MSPFAGPGRLMTPQRFHRSRESKSPANTCLTAPIAGLSMNQACFGRIAPIHRVRIHRAKVDIYVDLTDRFHRPVESWT